MAFVVPCPHCGIRLKCASRLPAGCHLTCPGCQNRFTTHTAAEPFDTSRSPKRFDEIPDAVILDDEPDDDRPATRTRPRKRRRDDSEPESPPRPKKSSQALVIGVAAGALLFLVVAGVSLYLIFGGSSKPASSDLFALAPTDTVILSGYDLEELGSNPACRKALEKREPPDLLDLDRAGVRSADLSRVLVARTVNNGNVCVIRFRSPPDQSKYLQPDLPGKTYAPFISASARYRFGYFDNSSTLVLADREAAIVTVKEKGPKVRISDDLKQMADKVRGPIWRASGRISAAESDRLRLPEEGVVLRIGPNAGTAAWAVLDGRSAEVQFELSFVSRPEATQGAGTLRGA